MQPACRCLHGGEPERVAVAQQVAGIGNARGVQLGTGLSASTACGGGGRPCARCFEVGGGACATASGGTGAAKSERRSLADVGSWGR